MLKMEGKWREKKITIQIVYAHLQNMTFTEKKVALVTYCLYSIKNRILSLLQIFSSIERLCKYLVFLSYLEFVFLILKRADTIFCGVNFSVI